ncbi:MAG: hypothetical protein LBJ07_01740, partial [Actinomycetes bacterium]|nr:hypothetical protein [Actinomycetes bacterium]
MRRRYSALVLVVALAASITLSACAKKQVREKGPSGDLLITQTLLPSNTPYMDVYGAVLTPTTLFAAASTDVAHFADQVIAAPVDDLKLSTAEVLYTSAFAATVDEDGEKTGAYIYSLTALDDGRLAFIDSDASGESEPLVIVGDPQTKDFAPLALDDVDTYYLDRIVARGNTLYFLAGQPMTEDEEALLDEENPSPLDVVDKANLMSFDTETQTLTTLYTGDKSSLKLYDLEGTLYWLGYEASKVSTQVSNVLYSYDTTTKATVDLARFDGAIAELLGAGDGRVIALELREVEATASEAAEEENPSETEAELFNPTAQAGVVTPAATAATAPTGSDTDRAMGAGGGEESSSDDADTTTGEEIVLDDVEETSDDELILDDVEETADEDFLDFGDEDAASTIEQTWHLWEVGAKNFSDIAPKLPNADGWGDAELAHNVMVYYSDAGMGATADNYGFS